MFIQQGSSDVHSVHSAPIPSELGSEGAVLAEGREALVDGVAAGNTRLGCGACGSPLSSWLTCTAPGMLERLCFVLLLPTGNWPP